jgi:hypothetical protein
LEDDVVIDLVKRAAAGSKLGFRNAPLKLLRVYLGEIGASLDKAARKLPDPVARELALDLWKAGCLKPLAPKPGTVAWSLQLQADGNLRMLTADLEQVAATFPASSRLSDLHALRRHLGWTVEFTLEPEAGVGMAELFRAAKEVHSVQGAAGAWVRAGTFGAITNRIGGLTLRNSSVPASGLIRLGEQGGLLGYKSEGASALSVAELGSGIRSDLANNEQLEVWLDGLAAGSTLQVEVPGSTTWGMLTNRIGPVLRRTDPTVLSPWR